MKLHTHNYIDACFVIEGRAFKFENGQCEVKDEDLAILMRVPFHVRIYDEENKPINLEFPELPKIKRKLKIDYH